MSVKMKWGAILLTVGVFTAVVALAGVVAFNNGGGESVPEVTQSPVDIPASEATQPPAGNPENEPSTAATAQPQPVDEMDAELIFARCIRENGFPEWPDPLPDGTFMMRRDQGMSFNDSRRAAAMEACQDLRPAGFSGSAGVGGAGGMTMDQETLLVFAQCMRDNGVPGFPDPSATGGGMIIGPQAGIDPNSPTFQAALRTCQAALQGGQ